VSAGRGEARGAGGGAGVWLRCYPRSWRARYGEELEDLIHSMSGEAPLPWRARIDLVRGGLRERARSFGFGGQGVPAGERARAGALLVLCAWAIFLVGGAVLQRFAENWQTLTPAGSSDAARAAFTAVEVLAALAAAIVLLGIACALPGLTALLRAGRWREIRRPILRALLLTLAASASVAAIAAWAHTLDSAQRNGSDTVYGLGFVAMALVCCACLAAWTAAAVTVARRLEPASMRLRLQAKLAGGAGAAMLAITAAVGVWWAVLATNAPWALHGDKPPLIGPGGLETSQALTLHGHSLASSPVTPQLLLAGALMAIATALATFGAIWALRAVPELDDGGTAPG
jgi:hypothetical protein